MATLVLTAVGTALGGPLGGALGGLVGQSIDQQLFGPGMRKGPRLGDLSIQTSSYGSPIPRIYGKMRVAGTVVWATDLKEGESIQGGGKSGPETLSYVYSVNLAVALSSRPIKAVRRIWADGKLIRGAADDFKVKTKFRVHAGDEDQATDPLIASVETIVETPAYRGLALTVFEDLELAEFGNRIPVLTFEVEADDNDVPLSQLLDDASGGIILADDPLPIPGYAAHGSSIGDSLRGLIELCGVDLAERDDALRSPLAGSPKLLAASELGCNADGQVQPKAERVRAPDSALPAGISMTYYDPDRDYQTGQMRASSGRGGARDERIELPAVLTAALAKQLVEQALARRWRAGDQLRLSLPPSRMDLSPGDAIQLTGSARAWMVRSVSIERMAVAIEAEAAPVTVPALPADPGRAVSEPDLPIGRTELRLFELPSLTDAPEAMVLAYVAAGNADRWKPVPVELALGSDPLAGVAMTRKAVMGLAETVLDTRAPPILDEVSTVDVRLANPAHNLLNADWGALMAGTNLALVGDELIQFGRADQLGPGLYRLSNLLRGRRGTEWAAAAHAIGDVFCMLDLSAVRSVELSASAVGAVMRSTAHGIGDVAPLPIAERQLTGESLRPPSPCHLKLWREGMDLCVEWVRRSHRGWTWIDGVGVAEDPFPELYLLTVTGPGGHVMIESATTSASFSAAQLPAVPGQQVKLSDAMVGPMALSREASATIIL
jgi:hypothetical protein